MILKVYSTGSDHQQTLVRPIKRHFKTVPVPTNQPSIEGHNQMDTVVVVEGDDVTLTCRSSGGVPDPVFSWYRDSGSGLIDPPLAGPSPSPVTLQYTGVRGHNGDNLVCQADQTQEAPDATEIQTTLVLDIQCE